MKTLMCEGVNFKYQMPAQLRFSDVDQFGHVNNSVYFSLFDMCKTRYFYDVVGPHVFDDFGIVVANVNANFIAPIFYPDDIVIETAVTRLGTKSFTLVQRALSSKTQSLKCECCSILVTFDTKTNTSICMPEDFKLKIAEYEDNSCLLG